MRIDGKHWHVWRARGPVWQRQIDANNAGCIAAVEQHLNAGSKTALYAMAIVAGNASEKSKAWGRDYTARVAKELGIKNSGVVVNPPRGPYMIKFYHCPAILVEPGFISNHDFGDVVQSGEGIDALARILVDSICAQFPDGGLVALSVGHAYRGVRDPGAKVNDLGDDLDPLFDDEVELNEAIITAAEEMLLAATARDTERPPAPEVDGAPV